jgi:hypothetical protein
MYVREITNDMLSAAVPNADLLISHDEIDDRAPQFMHILECTGQIVSHCQPFDPECELFLSFAIHHFSNSFELGFLPFLQSDSEGIIESIEHYKESCIGKWVWHQGHASHFDDIGMPDDSQEPSLDGQVDHSTDKCLRILERRFLQNLQGVSIVASGTNAMSGHEFSILDNIVNVVFVVKAMVASIGTINVIQRYFGYFFHDAKSSTAQDFTKRQFWVKNGAC